MSPSTATAPHGAGLTRIIYRINEDKHTVEIHSIRRRQAASNQINELYWDGDTRNGWIGAHTFQNAVPGTGIATMYFLDENNNPHSRLYYQDTQSDIVEQCYAESAVGQRINRRRVETKPWRFALWSQSCTWLLRSRVEQSTDLVPLGEVAAEVTAEHLAVVTATVVPSRPPATES